MFRITSKSKYGKVWDGAHAVSVLETDDAALAEKAKADNCIVEEIATDISKMNVAQLKKYAKDNGIEIGDATTKDAILGIIEAAGRE